MFYLSVPLEKNQETHMTEKIVGKALFLGLNENDIDIIHTPSIAGKQRWKIKIINKHTEEKIYKVFKLRRYIKDELERSKRPNTTKNTSNNNKKFRMGNYSISNWSREIQNSNTVLQAIETG